MRRANGTSKAPCSPAVTPRLRALHPPGWGSPRGTIAAGASPDGILMSALDQVLNKITKIVFEHEQEQRKLREARRARGEPLEAEAQLPGKLVKFKAGSSAQRQVKEPVPGSAALGRGLTDYLALPLDQYSLLDPRWITRPDPEHAPDVFVLKVPLQELLHVALQPQVTIKVSVEPEESQVRFEASSFQVGDRRFDACFNLDMDAKLSHRAPAKPSLGQGMANAFRSWRRELAVATGTHSDATTTTTTTTTTTATLTSSAAATAAPTISAASSSAPVAARPDALAHGPQPATPSLQLQNQQQHGGDAAAATTTTTITTTTTSTLPSPQAATSAAIPAVAGMPGQPDATRLPAADPAEAAPPTTLAAALASELAPAPPSSAAAPPATAAAPEHSLALVAAAPAGEAALAVAAPAAAADAGSLHCEVDLRFGVTLPSPLSVVPGPMLALAGNLLATFAVKALLPGFLELLSVDYGRWATGSSSRGKEAAGSLLAPAMQQQQQQQQHHQEQQQQRQQQASSSPGQDGVDAFARSPPAVQGPHSRSSSSSSSGGGRKASGQDAWELPGGSSSSGGAVMSGARLGTAVAGLAAAVGVSASASGAPPPGA